MHCICHVESKTKPEYCIAKWIFLIFVFLSIAFILRFVHQSFLSLDDMDFWFGPQLVIDFFCKIVKILIAFEFQFNMKTEQMSMLNVDVIRFLPFRFQHISCQSFCNLISFFRLMFKLCTALTMYSMVWLVQFYQFDPRKDIVC